MNSEPKRITPGVHRVSIIVPSLNSPIIDRVVDAIIAQEGIEEVEEIIVVGKNDRGLLPEASLLRFVDTGEPVNASAARNIGIESTSSDLLIFLDSDCVPQPGWLKEHVDAHTSGHHIVGGGVLPVGDDYWHLTYNLAMFHEVFSTAPAQKRDYLPTLNLSVEMQVIDDVGGLDESLNYSHDLDWTTRMRKAGYQSWFCPQAAVEHVHGRHTLRQVWDDCAVNGQYARQVRVEHADTLATPFILSYPWLTRLLSPLIALWVTGRILSKRPSTMLKHVSTLPAIFLTKLAWCWGAGRPIHPLSVNIR